MRSASFCIATAFCLVGCGGAPPAAPTTPKVVVARPAEAPARKDDESAWLTTCVQGTPEHRSAEKALADVNAKVNALDAAADPNALFAEIRKLQELPCFAVGEFGSPPSPPDSAFALKTYWNDGGHIALASRLAWAKPGERTFWLAPSMRRTLTKESAPRHPLLPLLCPALSGGCGADTEGWMLRADRFFETQATLHAAERPADGVALDTHASCIEKAKTAGTNAFDTFGRCMQSTRAGRDAFPLGKFRAPKDGWLVLRGRRGHHAWCSEIRAYDLSTGSAYVVARCGAMFGQTPSSPRPEKGKLPLDALREAALVMFLANASEHSVIVRGEGHHIPDEIAIRRQNEDVVALGGISESMSTGRTTLVYQWVRAGKSIAAGTVDWPDASDAADEHASSLLAIAEAAMTKGCAPAPLPILPHAARNERSTRVLAGEGSLPEYDDVDFAQLERDLATVGATAGKCVP